MLLCIPIQTKKKYKLIYNKTNIYIYIAKHLLFTNYINNNMNLSII